MRPGVAREGGLPCRLAPPEPRRRRGNRRGDLRGAVRGAGRSRVSEDEDGAVKWLEPFPTASEWPRMVTSVDVVAQSLERLPDRHVEEDSVVFVGADGGSVPFTGLESPDETRAGVSDRIDPIELGAEAFHDRRIQRSAHSGNVRLGQMKALRFHDQPPLTTGDREPPNASGQPRRVAPSAAARCSLTGSTYSRAASAWFCVEALTFASTASEGRKRESSSALISRGCRRP